jgi:hypothetical protein
MQYQVGSFYKRGITQCVNESENFLTQEEMLVFSPTSQKFTNEAIPAMMKVYFYQLSLSFFSKKLLYKMFLRILMKLN